VIISNKHCYLVIITNKHYVLCDHHQQTPRFCKTTNIKHTVRPLIPCPCGTGPWQ